MYSATYHLMYHFVLMRNYTNQEIQFPILHNNFKIMRYLTNSLK